jgi:hypothetical protein
MNGISLQSWAYIYTSSSNTWKLAASGDYNNDGCCDVVWQNSSTGQVVIYYMSGAAVRGWQILSETANPSLLVK